jgi:hypothetical protein
LIQSIKTDRRDEVEMDNTTSSDEPRFQPNPQDNFARANTCPACEQQILPNQRYGAVGHDMGSICGYYAHSDCDVLGVPCWCGRGKISRWLGDAPSSATDPEADPTTDTAEAKRKRADEDEQAEEEVKETEAQGPAKWQKTDEPDEARMAQDGD